MKQVNQTVIKKTRPVIIMQYGEGNFLRGFVEHMVDIANEKGVLNSNIQIVKSIPFGSLEPLISQECVYTVLLRGMREGKTFSESRVITCVAGAVGAHEDYDAYAALAKSPELRFIVSNTTEAGIVYDDSDDITLEPPSSFPGKLTKFLYERYMHFRGDKGGAEDKGLIILPVELIEKNGEALRDCCMRLAERWILPDGFKNWLTLRNIFCNTLVDRIITGYPAGEAAALEEELGYSDKQIVTGEPFALWVIECGDPEALAKELPLDKAGLPVVFTDNLQPYRERKVRLLNGAHTSSVLAAYLSGLDTVGDMMKDKTMRAFLEKALYSELSPMVPLPAGEVKSFADSVLERFENPFIRHNLLSIALNSVSKFRARVLPAILETQAKTGKVPPLLCFSLAALMAFYKGEQSEGKLVGTRGGEPYDIMDDAAVLRFFAASRELTADEITKAFLSRVDFWGTDLTDVPGFAEAVTGSLLSIREIGMRSAVQLTV